MVSPALQRGEKGFHKFVTESGRDGARTLFMQEPIAPKGTGFIEDCISNVRTNAPEAQSWLGTTFKVKGTGFSPYAKSSNETVGFSP